MVDFQFINLCSALHSIGEYELTSSYKIYVVAIKYGLEDKKPGRQRQTVQKLFKKQQDENHQ